MMKDWKAIASMIDSTLLRSSANLTEIEQLCREAVAYSFASVCINPIYVGATAELLGSSGVKACTVVGFPLGATFSSVKLLEVETAAVAGVQEIDLMMNLGSLLSGRPDVVVEEIASIVDLSKSYGIDTVKVILETCYLSKKQKIQACEVAIEGGAHYVKTSTGFGSVGATVEDVRLLRKVCAGRAKIKAAGGIRTLAQTVGLIQAGAERIGTSSASKIAREAMTSSSS